MPAGYEVVPQPTEFDYVPAPRITSVSTGTVADLKKYCVSPASAKCNAGQLASESGGLPANLVTVEGTGHERPHPRLRHPGRADERELHRLPGGGDRDIAGARRAGAPQSPTSPRPSRRSRYRSGSRRSSARPTKASVVYAGVPKVTKVVNPRTHKSGVPDSVACASSPPRSGCGTPLRHQRQRAAPDLRAHRLRRQPDWFLARHPVQLRGQERHEHHDRVRRAEPGCRRTSRSAPSPTAATTRKPTSCSSIHRATPSIDTIGPRRPGPLRAGTKSSWTGRTSAALSRSPSARSSPSRPRTRRHCWPAARPIK